MTAIAAIFVLLLTPVQENFAHFTYCRQNVSGAFESLCVQLDSSGAGETRFKRRDGDEMKFSMALSPGGKTQFLSALAGTKYLANSKNYASKRKVADLGVKRLALQLPSELREAEFNYSDLKEVNVLVTFFDGLLMQETLFYDLNWAVKFDPLGIPDRLDQIENVMKTSRIADTGSLIGVLDIIDRDDRIVNYARTHAREMKEKLSSGK